VDDLDDEERAELHQAIREGFDDAKAGRTIPAEQWIAELRSRIVSWFGMSRAESECSLPAKPP
jgi:predicted transcriptional regulator